jgi:hypothetical protein
MASMTGIWQKLERAKQHIADFTSVTQTFYKSAYTIGVRPHPVAAIEHTTLFVASVEPIPLEIALIIGDAVHNLRSVFDHLAWRLVEMGGGIPDRNTYFPIRATPQKYADAIGKPGMQGINPGALKIIEAMQPYTAGNEKLAQIHELDIVDKHRLVLTVTTVVRAWRATVAGMSIPFVQNPRPLEVGCEITNIPNSTYRNTGHENFELGIALAFGDSEVVAGKPVHKTLVDMAQFVEDSLKKLEPFL